MIALNSIIIKYVYLKCVLNIYSCTHMSVHMHMCVCAGTFDFLTLEYNLYPRLSVYSRAWTVGMDCPDSNPGISWWAFDTAVKLPHGMLTSCVRVTCSSPCYLTSPQLPIHVHPGSSKWWLCHPHGSPTLSFRLPALACLSLDCCRIWEVNQQIWMISHHLCLSMSVFQIKWKY